jgi:tetratricopeptide (TPR) repeat protein
METVRRMRGARPSRPAVLLLLAALGCAGPVREEVEASRIAEASRAGRRAETQRLYEAWIDQREPTAPGHWCALAEELCAAGAHDRALEVLERGLANWPGDPALLCARAAGLAHNGYLRAAERDLEAALARDPSRVDAWLELARLRLALDLPVAAQRALERCRDLDPGAPELELMCARALARRGLVEDALVHYGRAAARPEQTAAVLVEAARVVSADPDLAGAPTVHRAGGWVDRALEVTPESAELWSLRARLALLAGDPARAVECCRRALSVRADDVPALGELAAAYLELGQTERAETTVQRALDLERDPDRREALLALIR